MAYPTVDAVVVALVLALGAGYALARRLSWAFLALGLLLLAITDSAFVVASANGSYRAGTATDLRWIGAFALIALAAEAASSPRLPSKTADRATDLIEEAAPYLPLGVAMIVAATTGLTPSGHPVEFAMGCLLFVVASVRQVVLVFEHRRLTDTLDTRVATRTLALGESERRMRALLANLSDAVLIIDATTEPRRVSYASPAVQALLGVPPAELTHPRQLLDRLHPDDVARTRRAVEEIDQGRSTQRWQARLAHADGSWRTMELTGINLVADPAVAGNVVVLHDVTERERLQEELAFFASHDALTGLSNRRGLFDRLRGTLARADRRGERTALLLLDLDGFKAVNDTLGHAVGDELLLLAGQRLTASAREGDHVCRLGGDEFAVVLEPASGAEADLTDVVRACERLINALREPFVLPGLTCQPLQVSASGGLAVRQPGGPQDAGEMLREADLAMYAVKAGGKDALRIFDPGMRDTTLSRLALQEELRRAVREREFVLHYQPLFDVATATIRGVEALVRWQHPQRGLLPPADFIHAAEATGLIVPLGEQILAAACAQLRAWREEGGPVDLTVSVNISPRQLTPALTGHVTTALRLHDLPPSSLILEITEGLLADALPPCLTELTDLGVRLSVDDFGTGYSSLGRLREFPVSELKIDRTFMAAIKTDDSSAALAASIIALAHALDLSVVAEGIESEDQMTFLRQHGCELAQGFLLSRPVAPDKIGELLRQDSPRPPHHPPLLASEGHLVQPRAGLEQSVRRLLHKLEQITGYESTYLTVIDWDARLQQILYARNTGVLRIEEGLRVEWDKTVCRDMLNGAPRASADPRRDYPHSPAVAELGLGSYAGVPVHDRYGSVYGTLCAASTSARQLDDRTIRVMELFAELISENVISPGEAQ